MLEATDGWRLVPGWVLLDELDGHSRDVEHAFLADVDRTEKRDKEHSAEEPDFEEPFGPADWKGDFNHVSRALLCERHRISTLCRS